MDRSGIICDTNEYGDNLSEQEVKFKPSIQSNNLAETVANEELRKTDNFDTLRKSYLNLMHQLEIDGIPKHKISTVGQKIVIEKKRNIKKLQGASLEEIKKINIGSWWFDVAREQNFVDPNKSHSATDPEQKIVPLSKYEKENSEYIQIIKETKSFFDIALDKLKHNHFMSLLNDDDNKVLLALHDWKAQLEIANSFFDHKEKIPANTQHILLHAIGTMSSNNDAAVEYFRLRDESHKLTGKQLSKYRSGAIKTKLAIFNPKDRVSAILWNYFGMQCKKCESWRVLQLNQMSDSTKVQCQDCNNIFQVGSTTKCNYCGFPFFQDELSGIKKDKICPNCKQELPEYLINHITN